MATYTNLRRYYLLFEKISRSHFPTLSELKSFLEDHDLLVSNRTIHRDINHLRYDLGIDITWSKEEEGYYIDFEMSVNPEIFLTFLEMAAKTELLREGLHSGKDILKFISFESSGDFRGIGHLPVLLNAIKENRRISFVHFNYFTETETAYVVEPYFLKEYQNRWYLIGNVAEINQIRTFGLDRLKSLNVLSESFKQPGNRVMEIFDHVIGLNYGEDSPQEIVIRIQKPHDQYLKSLPLHSSQTVLFENEQYVDFQLFVVINFELVQKIMTQLDFCIVLQPETLRNRISTYLQAMRLNYSD